MIVTEIFDLCPRNIWWVPGDIWSVSWR